MVSFSPQSKPGSVAAIPRFRKRRSRMSIFARLLGAVIWVAIAMSDIQAEKPSSSNSTEPREPASWEEPSLFPPETSPRESAAIPVRPGRRRGEALPPLDPVTSDATTEASSEHAAAAFQNDLGNIGYSGSQAVGLESLRQRDAILARAQRDTFDQPYNIKIGRLPLRLGASLDANFTDNSRRSNGSRASDVILIPRIDLSGSLRLASRLSLNVDLGIGYIKYLGNTENDRVLPIASLSPGADAGISLNMKVGKFMLSVFETPVVPQFQLDASTQRRQQRYDQFSNTAGLTVLWDMNSRTSMTFRYGHSNTFSIGSGSNSTNGSGESFLASLSYKLSDSLGVSVDAGADITKYKQNLLNNGTTYHIGPVVNLALSDYLQIRASIGYQGGNYDSGGQVGDNSSLGSYFANVSISNALNTHFNHGLSFGHEAQRGAASNFSEVNYVRYQFSWDVIRMVSLSAWASFEDITESGGLFANHLQYYSFGLNCGFRLTKHITISLGYEFTKRDATEGGGTLDGDNPSFYENRIFLHAGYAF